MTRAMLLAELLPDVAASANLRIDAIYTHFATADDPEHAAFGEQRERFDAACAQLAELGIPVPARHAANSAAFLRDERVWLDFIPRSWCSPARTSSWTSSATSWRRSCRS